MNLTLTTLHSGVLQPGVWPGVWQPAHGNHSVAATPTGPILRPECRVKSAHPLWPQDIDMDCIHRVDRGLLRATTVGEDDNYTIVIVSLRYTRNRNH